MTHCTKDNKKNKCRLNPLSFPITYASSEIISTLSLPRKYTSTHNDDLAEIYLSIGPTYNQKLLNTEEVRNVESQVLGKWVKKGRKYEIHLTVLVSTEKNPQAQFRNEVFCREMGPVLEGIALAETALLEAHPKLGSTKIYIHFKSIEKKYDRVEYWHKLKYWRC